MSGMIPGQIIVGDEPVELFGDRTVIEIEVVNTGDRPVQVGSHYHFAESNTALDFDRDAAWGHRLAVPAGTSVRFEPGMPRDVELIPFTGRRIVPGLRGLAAGPLDRVPEAPPADPEDIEPAGSLDEDTGEDQPSNGSPR